MAKIYFENRFILTKKLYKQYCKVCFKKARVKNRLICVAMALLSIIIAVLGAIFKIKAVCLVGFVMLLYFFMMIFWGYKVSEYFSYRQLQSEHGKAIVNILQFSPKLVFLKVNKTSLSFKYETIEKAYETDDIIVLVLARRGMVEHGQIIYKRGFTNDTSIYEFKKLINEKSGSEIFELDPEA